MHLMRKQQSKVWGMMVLAVVAGTALWMNSGLHADDRGQKKEGATLAVGVYQPEAVFQAYHGREAFVQRVQAIQMNMQKAHQEGDQQRLVSLQQEMQGEQQKVLAQFEKDIRAAAPAVAKDQKVQVVAVDVVYQSDAVQQKDVTRAVVQKVNASAEAKGREGGAEQPILTLPDLD